MRILPNISARTKAGVLAAVLRAWLGSLQYRFVLDDPDVAPQRMACRGLYAFWHEALLFPLYTHAAQISPLISRSRDGDTISRVVRHFGGEVIRGSTDHGGQDRGGRQALRQILGESRFRHVGVPVDGPVGPRRIVPPGPIVSASRGRMPIVPCGMAPVLGRALGPENCKVTLPLPFSHVWIVTERPIHLPERITRPQRDAYVARLQAALDRAQARAEQYAAGRRPPARALSLRQVRAL